MDKFQLTTPIVFIIFNRPDTTERVFAEIAKAKPLKLLVIGDGARDDRTGEGDRVAATRAIIERVNWPCEVLTNYSDINLGCRQRLSSGLDWAFSCVPEAIILEDDCLPHQTFFRFCEEMLNHYRGDQRISHINGNNLHFSDAIRGDSYFFSSFVHVWGWATWGSRWKHDYDVSMKSWPKVKKENRIQDWTEHAGLSRYLNYIFEETYSGRVDTWDYQWSYASRLNGRLSIVPGENLICNIGFGPDATHTTSSNGLLVNMKVFPMNFPLTHPLGVFASRRLDEKYAARFLIEPFYRRVLGKLRRILGF